MATRPEHTTLPAAERPRRDLAYLPVSAFSIVMGLAGTAIAWHWAHLDWGTPVLISTAVSWLALGVFAVLATAYLTKVVRHLGAVRAEWRHPVSIAFVPTITIAMLILSVTFLDTAPGLSQWLWWVGSAGQLVLTLDILRVWISDARFQATHVHPAWFIPVVGNLAVPLAGTTHAPIDLSWFFFAIGIVYWLALLPIVLNRLFLVGTMPAKLAPTLAILVAPPAVAALAWVRLGGAWTDPVTRILLGVTIFQLMLLAVQANELRRIPFALSAWAYTFPVAAATAGLLAAHHGGLSVGYTWIGGVTLSALSVVVLGLLWRTGLAVRRGEICRPEPEAAAPPA